MRHAAAGILRLHGPLGQGSLPAGGTPATLATAAGLPFGSGAPILPVLSDLLDTDPVTGKNTGLTRTIRRTLQAVEKAGIRYSVIGATALAVRGLPRMTRDLDLTVGFEDASALFAVLRDSGLRAVTPTGSAEDPEAMVVFVDENGVEVLVAAGDPESTVLDQATRTMVFGAEGRVATLEHLLLLYLYSNQPKHLGDFAAIVNSGRADLVAAEASLRDMHPEMLDEWRRRVRLAQSPPPPPSRPPRRRRPAGDA